MVGGIVTLAFVVLMLLVGGLLFDTSDWGKPVKPYSGIVHGKYLPPVYLRNRPINKVDMQAYRDFHARHAVVSDREFSDMIERS